MLVTATDTTITTSETSTLVTTTPTLSKLNRTIDNIMPATSYKTTRFSATNLNNSSNICVQPKLNIKNYPSNDDNQTKRNDVHYLLKQLNSFSDIEEIEIVDIKQQQLVKQNEQKQQQQSCHRLESKSGLATIITTAIASSSSNKIRHSISSTHGAADVYSSTTSRMSGDVIHTHLGNNNLNVSTSYSNSNSVLGGGETTKTSFFKCCYTSLDKWRDKKGSSGGKSSHRSGEGDPV